MRTGRFVAILAVTMFVLLAGCSATVSNTPTVTDEVGGQTTSPPSSPTDSPSEPGANGTLKVHFINVGQGGSTLVVGPSNETMLIDTGDWTDDGEDVLSYLQELGIERIDNLVTTHADADHIGGHAAVIEYFETEADGVGAVYDPGIASSSQTYQNYLDAIEEYNVTLYETRADDRIPFAGVETSVLSPPEGYVAGGERNENSLVLHLRFGQASFLLPGDVEESGEQFLIEESGSAVNASVLQVGHHGSRSSSSNAFLDLSQPRIAVISSGYDSQYGHPHEEVLHRLSERSIRTYWTATHGTIRITTNGSAVTVATQNTAPTDPMALRDGSAIDPGATNALEVRTTIAFDGQSAKPIVTDGGTAMPTASSTPPETTTQSSASAQGADQLSVASVHADAAGDEYANLNDEYIVFENTGASQLDLSDWVVSDEADHRYTFPSGFTLESGQQVTLHTGMGTDNQTDLYWGSDAPVWNNDGDTIIVQNEVGECVLEEEY